MTADRDASRPGPAECPTLERGPAIAAVAAPDRETEFRARRMALVRDIAAHGVRDSAALDAMRRSATSSRVRIRA